MSSNTDFKIDAYYFWLYYYRETSFERKRRKIDSRYKRQMKEVRNRLFSLKYGPEWRESGGVAVPPAGKEKQIKALEKELNDLSEKTAREEVREIRAFWSRYPFHVETDYDMPDALELLGWLEEVSFEDAVKEASVKRTSSNFGVSLEGLRETTLSEDGHLLGSILLDINLSADTEVLVEEIRRLKALKFESLPTFIELTTAIEDMTPEYALEKELINKTGGTLRSAYAPRAIGLWLSEYIYRNECTQKAAIMALCERHDLSVFGKDGVEDSDLRKYVRKTEACIKAGEVLPFK